MIRLPKTGQAAWRLQLGATRPVARVTWVAWVARVARKMDRMTRVCRPKKTVDAAFGRPIRGLLAGLQLLSLQIAFSFLPGPFAPLTFQLPTVCLEPPELIEDGIRILVGRNAGGGKGRHTEFFNVPRIRRRRTIAEMQAPLAVGPAKKGSGINLGHESDGRQSHQEQKSESLKAQGRSPCVNRVGHDYCNFNHSRRIDQQQLCECTAKDSRSAADVFCVRIHRLMNNFTYSSPRRETGVSILKKLAIIGLALLFAACAPMQTKTVPEKATTPQAKKPQRFDGLSRLALGVAPERDGIRDPFRYDRAIRTTEIDGLRYYFYKPERQHSVVGFTFLNDGSATINPVGLKRKGPRREYAFHFADRARENIYLAVNDDVKISGRFSHDNMFRELHFFPRKQLPSLEIDSSKHLLEVTLPTGEEVFFDEESMEVVGGALKEAPIDFNRSRHLRRNPEVRYQGKYLAITVAQRGESPRRAKVWGQRKFAEIHYPAKYSKTCKVSPAHIWDQKPKPGDNDPKLTMLHKSDAELFAMIERRCGWDLSQLTASTDTIADARK